MNSFTETPRFLFIFANADRTLPGVKLERDGIAAIFTQPSQDKVFALCEQSWMLQKAKSGTHWDR